MSLLLVSSLGAFLTMVIAINELWRRFKKNELSRFWMILEISLVTVCTLFTIYVSVANELSDAEKEGKQERNFGKSFNKTDSVGTKVIETVDKSGNRIIDSLQNATNQLSNLIKARDEQIKVRDQEIDDLKSEVRKAKKGITSSIDFDGSHRSSTAGGFSGNFGGTAENKVFSQITELRGKKQSGEVIKLCDKAMKEFPTWHAPHYFKAVTLIDGNKLDKEALRLLQVIEESEEGVPDYINKIAEIYSYLGNEKKANQLRASLSQ